MAIILGLLQLLLLLLSDTMTPGTLKPWIVSEEIIAAGEIKGVIQAPTAAAAIVWLWQNVSDNEQEIYLTFFKLVKFQNRFLLSFIYKRKKNYQRDIKYDSILKNV